MQMTNSEALARLVEDRDRLRVMLDRAIILIAHVAPAQTIFLEDANAALAAVAQAEPPCQAWNEVTRLQVELDDAREAIRLMMGKLDAYSFREIMSGQGVGKHPGVRAAFNSKA